MNQNFVHRFHALLALGRVSNLPTVWSNCLAGWLLGGGENFWKLPLLFLGVGALYTGGMFLNDAFDAEFDRQRHPSRPIPAGVVTREQVWIWSFSLLAVGALLLAFISKTAGILAVILLAGIVIYNATHRAFIASPWLMGLCRFWVYVIAGSTGVWGLNGWPIWCGAALAFYIVGLSYIAQRKMFRGPVPYWPLIFFAAPVLLAILMDIGHARKTAMLFSVVLVLWIARCVRTIFQHEEVNAGKIVSGLLAGIIFVDWLAVAPFCPKWFGAVFLILFGATLISQRFIPSS